MILFLIGWREGLARSDCFDIWTKSEAPPPPPPWKQIMIGFCCPKVMERRSKMAAFTTVYISVWKYKLM